jgi:hypothetical protein
MKRISLDVPRPIVESLPDDADDTTEEDMARAVEGVEGRLNEAIGRAGDETEAAEYVATMLDRLRNRVERYDQLVPELRAWGQSPIYAIAWRNLNAQLIEQIRDYEWLDEHIDRERPLRMVGDGVRFSDR